MLQGMLLQLIMNYIIFHLNEIHSSFIWIRVYVCHLWCAFHCKYSVRHHVTFGFRFLLTTFSLLCAVLCFFSSTSLTELLFVLLWNMFKKNIICFPSKWWNLIQWFDSFTLIENPWKLCVFIYNSIKWFRFTRSLWFFIIFYFIHFIC